MLLEQTLLAVLLKQGLNGAGPVLQSLQVGTPPVTCRQQHRYTAALMPPVTLM
jgi:hypothetical protein